MSNFPKRLVYVDDEPDVRQVVREALERTHPHLIMVTCSSGAELLNRLRELQPEMILLDLKMPKMSGPDVVDALRKRPEGAEIPVIFITGKTKVHMTDEYKSLGVIGVIYKPLDILSLGTQIEDMWKAHNAPKIPDQ
jgi:two-component system OmpR family response regulator